MTGTSQARPCVVCHVWVVLTVRVSVCPWCAVLCSSSVCVYSGISLLQVCTHCNGYGACWQGECQCSEGRATQVLPDNTTTANGSSSSSSLAISDTTLSGLVDAVIVLDEENACLLASCPLDCSGHGVCQADASSQTTNLTHSHTHTRTRASAHSWPRHRHALQQLLNGPLPHAALCSALLCPVLYWLSVGLFGCVSWCGRVCVLCWLLRCGLFAWLLCYGLQFSAGQLQLQRGDLQLRPHARRLLLGQRVPHIHAISGRSSTRSAAHARLGLVGGRSEHHAVLCWMIAPLRQTTLRCHLS